MLNTRTPTERSYIIFVAVLCSVSISADQSRGNHEYATAPHQIVKNFLESDLASTSGTLTGHLRGYKEFHSLAHAADTAWAKSRMADATLKTLAIGAPLASGALNAYTGFGGTLPGAALSGVSAAGLITAYVLMKRKLDAKIKLISNSFKTQQDYETLPLTPETIAHEVREVKALKQKLSMITTTLKSLGAGVLMGGIAQLRERNRDKSEQDDMVNQVQAMQAQILTKVTEARTAATANAQALVAAEVTRLNLAQEEALKKLEAREREALQRFMAKPEADQEENTALRAKIAELEAQIAAAKKPTAA